MLNNTEKPDFMNTRAVGVCPKVTVLSNGTGKNRIITEFCGKPGMEWIFLDPAVVNFVKL